MNTPMIPPKTNKAFTLIELLTVIAIIAVLMGLLFPAIGSVKEAARKTQAKNDEVQMVNAIKAFYIEYGKYPISPVPNTAVDVAFNTPDLNATLFDILRNNTGGGHGSAVQALNPKQITFIEAPAVQSTTAPKSGVVVSGANAGTWYDPWGTQYFVGID